MFFDNILVNNKVLRPVWKAGNSMSEETDGNTSLPIICSKLDCWVGSESMDASQRLSLRTSAILIDGAAKIYKKEMEQLIKDVAKLDNEIIIRNRRDGTNFEDETSISTSRSCDTPEQMMRRAEIDPDISFEAPTRNPFIYPPTLHRDDSFIASTPSPFKRKREDIIDVSPKRQLTNSDQSKETTPYPWSKSSGSDHTEKSLESSDQRFDHEKSSVSRTKSDSNDSRSESQASKSSESQRVYKSSDRQNLTSDSDQSLRQRTERSCDSQNQTDQTVKNTVQDPEINSEISLQLETLKSLLQESDKRSQSSPTFTEIFDILANLPNERDKTDSQTDIKNISHFDTGKKTDRGFDERAAKEKDRNGKSSDVADIEKSSDLRNAIEPDQASQGSHRSIILKTTKKSHPKLRRKKKGSKPIKILKDQATQVVSYHPRMAERESDTFNERLPFAYLLIHDSYNSRLPSKIVISSLNEDINNLVCL